MSSSNYRRNKAFIDQFRKELKAEMDDLSEVDVKVLKLYLSDGKIYVSLKNHELKYDVLIVRFGKYIPKNG